MRLNFFIDKFANVKAENRLLKFAVVIVAAASVMSAIVSYSALKYQKVVILPPVVDSRIEISGNNVNDDYVKLFARYAMGLMLNYTPHTFRGQSSELLKLVTPEFYNTFHGTVTAMADDIERLLISSVFYPQKLSIDQEKKEVTVQGLRRQHSHDSPIEDKQKKYMMRYKIINGRFHIDDIKEIDS
ncbi:MAG: type IV conjugative transfer system protein TraE [Candidatus Altiarchaeota archaeon]|nr:type IV conjugative transfer system protein TraE [Candidatus Altiarchaeota archaeon]